MYLFSIPYESNLCLTKNFSTDGVSIYIYIAEFSEEYDMCILQMHQFLLLDIYYLIIVSTTQQWHSILFLIDFKGACKIFSQFFCLSHITSINITLITSLVFIGMDGIYGNNLHNLMLQKRMCRISNIYEVIWSEYCFSPKSRKEKGTLLHLFLALVYILLFQI